jgi:hypothetical protein
MARMVLPGRCLRPRGSCGVPVPVQAVPVRGQAMAASPTSPSFTASQRRRVTLWVQARRNVPVSSSRAIRGAPKKNPMSAGATCAMNGSAPCRSWAPQGPQISGM